MTSFAWNLSILGMVDCSGEMIIQFTWGWGMVLGVGYVSWVSLNRNIILEVYVILGT